MNRELPIEIFVTLLGETGVRATAEDVRSDVAGLWARLPGAARDRLLTIVGLRDADPRDVAVRVEDASVVFATPETTPATEEAEPLVVAPAEEADEPLAMAPPAEDEDEDDDVVAMPPAEADAAHALAEDEPDATHAMTAPMEDEDLSEDAEDFAAPPADAEDGDALELPPGADASASLAEIADDAETLPGEPGDVPEPDEIGGLPAVLEPEEAEEDADADPTDPEDAADEPLEEGQDGLWVVPREELEVDEFAEAEAPPVEEDEPAEAPPSAEAAEAEAEAPENADPKKKGRILGRFFKGDKESDEAEAPEEHVPPGEVTTIPPITDPDVEEVEVYGVQEPYAYVRILYHKENHEHLYEVIEPPLDERERNILEFIEDTLVDVIDVGLSAVTREEAANMLREHVDEIIYDYSILVSPLAKEKILYYILRDFLGFGKLDPIMRDDQIEDVSCDGPKIPIFLYHRKYESIKSIVKFGSHEEADSYVIKMAQRSGKHISIAEPLLDATLPDGSRLNATLSDEVTANGSTFTIRKFKEEPFTAPDLVRFGTMSAEMLAYWWIAVQNGASAIYAGGTASGKTTSLNAILLFIPPQMKIVSIEDTREVNLPHENWIPGVTRSGFGPRDSHGRQAGEIDMFSLLKAALRQRPEYILVGEVRGQEAYALFQAMATGHTAYGTMHADSVESVIHRLESEPISIPRSLLEALDIVSVQIQTRIGEKRVRRTKQMTEVVGLDPHTQEILTNEVFTWNPARDEFEFSGVSYVLERVQIERNLSEFEMRKELRRRKEVIEWMVAMDIHDYRRVSKIIQSYYKDRDTLLAQIREEMAGRAGEEEAAEGDGADFGEDELGYDEEDLMHAEATVGGAPPAAPAPAGPALPGDTAPALPAGGAHARAPEADEAWADDPETLALPPGDAPVDPVPDADGLLEDGGDPDGPDMRLGAGEAPEPETPALHAGEEGENPDEGEVEDEDVGEDPSGALLLDGGFDLGAGADGNALTDLDDATTTPADVDEEDEEDEEPAADAARRRRGDET